MFQRMLKADRERERLEAEKRLREDIRQREERIKANEKAKEKMETGNSTADFNNSIDILSKL